MSFYIVSIENIKAAENGFVVKKQPTITPLHELT